MEVQGRLHLIKDTEQVTDTFRKREFVLEYAENPMYPQYVLFQLVQDRCDLIENYSVGDTVTITFNLRGRQWNSPQGETKFFNSLEAWRINPVAATGTPTQPTHAKTPVPVTATAAGPMGSQVVDVSQMDDDDDLPF